MDVKDAIHSRRSIRKYERRPMPKDVLDDLLDSARLAPSSNNLQNWSMVVITDDALKQKLVPASGNQKFVGECSAYIVAIVEKGSCYPTIDAAIALDHLSLRAVELGLGTCWIGDFEQERVKELLGIPRELEVAICMTVGYPAQAPAARRRKPLTELFRSNAWEQDYR